MKLHLAETYHSLKGEGLYTGVPMFFIRFAGCNVGRRGSHDTDVTSAGAAFDSPLVVKGTTCHTWDGRAFGCDTDYPSKLSWDLADHAGMEALFATIWERRVVLTGGEPMMQLGQFVRLIELCKVFGKIPHVETSGTIHWNIAPEDAWIACAPKAEYKPQMLQRADEIKLLVDESFNIEAVPLEVYDHDLVWLMPINQGRGFNDANYQKCYDIIKQQPRWRLGDQMHKRWGIR